MPKEFWAVFENWDSRAEGAEKRDIYNFDCVGTFPTEQEAIDCEMKNPDYRVRKLIRNTMAAA